MTDSVRTYDIYYTHGTSDEIDAEGYRYIVKDDVSHEPLPAAIARVVFTRDDRAVMTVNASAVVSIRERAETSANITKPAYALTGRPLSDGEHETRHLNGDLTKRLLTEDEWFHGRLAT